VLEHVRLVVRDGRITDFASGVRRSATERALTTDLLIPGLINAHTHSPMTLLKGLGDDASFDQWLNEIILPAERDLVGPAFVRRGAAIAADEFIRGGVTTVQDMYYCAPDSADVLRKRGLRVLACVTILDLESPDTRGLSEIQRIERSFALLDVLREKSQRDPGLISVVGPHAPYTCSDETLRRCRDYAKRHGLRIHIHLSETEREVAESRARHAGRSPVERLRDVGLLGPLTSCAHGVHLSAGDLNILADTQTALVSCPESNLKLASGIADVRGWLRAGIRCGLGTDGSASNNDLSMWGEMDTLAKVQKYRAGDSSAFGALEAFWMATLGGAQALSLDGETGSLDIGKSADLVGVSLAGAHVQPASAANVQSLAVYNVEAHDVEWVLGAGKRLNAPADGPSGANTPRRKARPKARNRSQ